MKSTAATYGGPGAPPPLTHGDIDAMATVRHSSIDPTLNPGAPWAIESTHTSVTAAAAADAKTAAAAETAATAKEVAENKADALAQQKAATLI
jgi:hypothetical protein